MLQPGDIEQWDFRSWSYSQFVPAMIGSFPQPFVSGFEGNTRPTVIASAEAFLDTAGIIADRLISAGSPAPEVIDIGQLDTASCGDCNLILIAEQSAEPLEEANTNHQKLSHSKFVPLAANNKSKQGRCPQAYTPI